MKMKYARARLIVPFLAVIASISCMFAYRPPFPNEAPAKIQKQALPQPNEKSSLNLNKN